MQKHFLGIDPGNTGAVCRICSPEIEIFDWAGVVETSEKIREWTGLYNISGAYIEDIQPMPDDRNHIVSLGKLVRNAGHWEGILSACGISVKRISPRQWRKTFCYRYGNKKEIKKVSLYHAREIFKEYEGQYFSRMKDHNRAEAALIAYQCERYFEG